MIARIRDRVAVLQQRLQTSRRTPRMSGACQEMSRRGNAVKWGKEGLPDSRCRELLHHGQQQLAVAVVQVCGIAANLG